MRLNDVITSGSFIQSTINRMPQQGTDYPSTNHGNFQVLVQEGNNLVHYWHDNTQDLNAYWPSQPPSSPNGRPSEGWQRAQTITSKATGPGCIIQSDFR